MADFIQSVYPHQRPDGYWDYALREECLSTGRVIWYGPFDRESEAIADGEALRRLREAGA